MLVRVQRVMLWVVLALLASSAAMALFSAYPTGWFEAPPVPPKPLPVELIEPTFAAGAKPSRGMSIGRDGIGTILAAPGRHFVPDPASISPPERRSTAEPLVAAEIAGRVRLLARLAPSPPSTELVTINLDEPPPQFGTLILRNGCLRLAEAGEPHAVLPPGTRLHIDGEGFLTAGIAASGAAMSPRLGEPAWWPERIRLPVDAAAAARIRAKCGPGAVRVIGSAQSVSASQAAADGMAARNLASMYGLPWKTALVRVRTCRDRLARNSGIDPTRMIYNPCGSTPPSPVAEARYCPAGTTLSGGLCRTAEGHVRPVPPL